MRHSLLLAGLLAGSLTAQLPQGLLIDTTLDQLFTVDLTTGAATFLVQVTGLSTAADLAWREDTRELWSVDLSGGAAGTIDLTTGAFTPIFATGQNGWQGMAWDPLTRRFYLANQSGSNFVLDPATGATTLLGPAGFSLLTGLAVDAHGTLWGIDFSTGRLVTIDKTTGAGTAVSTVSPANFQGIAFAPDGRLYGENTTTDALYLIDPVTGAATLLGTNGGGVTFAKGMEILGTEFNNGGRGCPDGNNELRSIVGGGVPARNSTFTVTVEQGSTPVPCFVVLGLSNTTLGGVIPLPADLGSRGAPGCTLYSSADAVNFSVSGFPIPVRLGNNPAFVGALLFNQGLVLDISSNPNALGIVTTPMQRVVIMQ